LYLLEIGGAQARLVERPDLKGLGNYSTADKLRKECGVKAALMTIGPAEEKGLRTACIANVDVDGRPSRVNGRDGLGAVMGSKGVKAIVGNAEGVRPRRVMDSSFTTAVKEYARVLGKAP